MALRFGFEMNSTTVARRVVAPDRGDEARLLSSFLGWRDRRFSEQLSSVTIEY
jgi:hypothetical protein